MTPSRAPLLTVLAGAALLAGAAAAAAQPEPPANRGDSTSLRQCIDQTFSWSWTPYDDHTILVRSGGHAFQITTNRCPRLADPLPTITTKVSGGQICSPHDVRLFVSDSADRIPIPCFVQSITPLTEEQAKAIESRGR